MELEFPDNHVLLTTEVVSYHFIEIETQYIIMIIFPIEKLYIELNQIIYEYSSPKLNFYSKYVVTINVSKAG